MCMSINIWAFQVKTNEVKMVSVFHIHKITSLVQIFPKALLSYKQGGGDYMTGLVQTSSEETRFDPRPLWLLVGTPLVLGPELASRRGEHSLLWRMYILYLYIFDMLFLSPNMFV